jgi:hypothetical protein
MNVLSLSINSLAIGVFNTAEAISLLTTVFGFEADENFPQKLFREGLELHFSGPDLASCTLGLSVDNEELAEIFKRWEFYKFRHKNDYQLVKVHLQQWLFSVSRGLSIELTIRSF